jgi:hypothetical protein
MIEGLSRDVVEEVGSWEWLPWRMLSSRSMICFRWWISASDGNVECEVRHVNRIAGSERLEGAFRS